MLVCSLTASPANPTLPPSIAPFCETALADNVPVIYVAFGSGASYGRMLLQEDYMAMSRAFARMAPAKVWRNVWELTSVGVDDATSGICVRVEDQHQLFKIKLVQPLRSSRVAEIWSSIGLKRPVPHATKKIEWTSFHMYWFVIKVWNRRSKPGSHYFVD